MVKLITGVVLFAVFVFVLVTYIALESGDVIKVETRRSEFSELRVTHIWFVHSDDQIFLEAGHPENPWVRDLSESETIWLRGNGIDGEYQFDLIDAQTGQEEIRKRMREKYGWRDVWISCIFNVSESRMVKVSPT